MSVEYVEIYFNKQNIVFETRGAILMRCPKKSRLTDFEFWCPKSFVETAGGKGYHKMISCPSDFTFTAQKSDKNFNVIDKKTLTAEDVKQLFGDSIKKAVETERNRKNPT